jgi:DNA-binding beta-propeller fold protein YncE
MRTTIRRAVTGVAGMAVAFTGLAVGGLGVAPAEAAEGDDVRRVVFVGNNWGGTADILVPGTLRRIGTIDVVPDYNQRFQEIMFDPTRLAYFLAIRTLIGEGHDQLVDDMYSSNDGKLVVISRPSFADVVAISLKTKKIVWRFKVSGVRSDHMAVSPNGRNVVVSASTGNIVHVLRISDGKEIGRFKSGGSPHESVYIDGGKRILHASIGTVYSPFDDPGIPDPLEGQRVFQIVNAKTFKVERRFNVRQALDERGLKDLSVSVRPMTLSPDEKTIYFQVSYFHGYLAMSRKTGKITHVTRLPNLIPNVPRVAYLLDSAHHGIAADPTGRKICVAGTMSDYAAVVNVKTSRPMPLIKGGLKPYWVTQSWDGKHCLISWSGSDKISKISYRTGKIVATQAVGDHPQRIRNGFLRTSYAAGLGVVARTKPLAGADLPPSVWERPGWPANAY